MLRLPDGGALRAEGDAILFGDTAAMATEGAATAEAIATTDPSSEATSEPTTKAAAEPAEAKARATEGAEPAAEERTKRWNGNGDRHRDWTRGANRGNGTPRTHQEGIDEGGSKAANATAANAQGCPDAANTQGCPKAANAKGCPDAANTQGCPNAANAKGSRHGGSGRRWRWQGAGRRGNGRGGAQRQLLGLERWPDACCLSATCGQEADRQTHGYQDICLHSVSSYTNKPGVENPIGQPLR
jgi:hypothetical protein